MASIVKELDKISGTKVRSHNITDALKKLGAGPSKNIADAVSRVEVGGGDNAFIIEFADGVYPTEAFNVSKNIQQKNIAKVVLPKTVTRIDSSGFGMCQYVKEYDISNVETITEHPGWRPFFETLIALKLETVTASGFSSGNSSLKLVRCPKLKSLPNGAFNGCSNLEYLDVENIETIGHEAFKTNKLTGDFYFNKLENISAASFSGLSGSGKLIFPVSESVQPAAFSNLGSADYNIYLGPNTVMVPVQDSETGENTWTQFAGVNGGLAFKGTINCAFDEGEVEGAPWGADESATINYNVSVPTK